MSAVELYNAAVALGRNEARTLVAESICSEATKQEVLERLGLRADEVEHEPKRQPGDEIAHYVVTGELGRGGMGVVYSATDTFLGREVALKFVSKATLKDSAAALLEREAKTACALNHPNIVTVHEVIRAGTGVAIVMEKVEGVSLRKFMADARGTRSVVEIGRQIALATAAAHSHGIIHRDLKPENVMVRPDGYVKVLDFGLARQADAGAGATSRAWAGTLRYMSPEQANAEPLTPASDVYSLGLILYEMCAGRHAFQTESALATVHAIATRDAQALSVTCAGMPEWLSELIGSMLRRDPAARPTARSVAEALHSGTLPQATVEGDPVARTIAADRPTVTRRVWIGMATAALGAIAYLEFKRPAGQPKAVVDTRVDLATAGELEEEGFALSPDGQTLLVVAAGQLKYVSLAGGGATVWEGAAEGRFPFWSPDGREAGFYWKNKLWRKGFPNGPLREICEASEPVAASWGSRDTIVFSAGDGPIKHVPASGGTPVAVTRLNGALFDAAPTFLPDGVRFVFYRAMDPSEGALMTGTTDGTNATARLGPAATSAVYVAGPQSSPGALVYTRQGKLLAHPFDLSRAGFAGSPYIVAERAREFRRRVIPASAAAGGAFVYVAEEDKRDHAKIFNRAGRLIARLGPRREYIRARPSPDFQRIAMASRDPATMQHQLELLDRRSGATQALGSPELMRVPVWSPDGTKIAFTTRSGTSEYVLTIQNAAERNSKTTLRLLPYDSWPHDWSPDGTLLLVTAQTSGVDRSVWALPLDPARVPFPIVRTPGKNDEPHWSPDGRFIAYQSNESGRTEVHVIPFPPDGRRWQVSTEGGQEPRWRADGKELYFLSLDYALMVSSTSLKGKDFSFGPSTMLFGGRSSEPSLMVWHAEPSPDGREFLILTSARSAGSTMRLRLNGWAPGGDAGRGR